MERQLITAPDGHQIETFIWQNPEAKAWVHILHGMAEHAERYDDTAQNLVQAGYAVVAHNHRGHGNIPEEEFGLFALKDGWKKVIEDVNQVREEVCSGPMPYFLLGHSMGSFIAQAYMSTQPTPIKGLILSGTNIQPKSMISAGHMVAKVERLRLSSNKVSGLLQKLSFESFNNAFMPIRTDFDWLSRDEALVDKTIDDPRCGFECKIQLWLDLFTGLKALYSNEGYKRIQDDLPIYIFGGDQDPVGAKGKGLYLLSKAYKEAGQPDVTLKIYEGGRHEMLNETNKEEVYEDLITWLNAH